MFVCIFRFVMTHLCMLHISVGKVPAFALGKNHFKLPAVTDILR